MKLIMIAAMLIISSVGFSQLQLTSYDSSNVETAYNKYNSMIEYSIVKNAMREVISDYETDDTFTTYYAIKDVWYSNDPDVWIGYDCVNDSGAGVFIVCFLRHNAIKKLYDDKSYSICIGGGLTYPKDK